MQSRFLLYKNSSIHYQVFGSGNRVLLCFHGYGLAADSFHFLEKILGEKFTCYAFDLPFHGKTQWNETGALQPTNWWQIVQQIIPPNNTKLALLGYSMGGRVALQLAQQYPENIAQIGLVAPDGLYCSIWQYISTQTRWGNQCFRFFMCFPGFIQWLAAGMSKIGLVNKSVLKFVRHYIDDAKERDLLYRRWTVMRYFKPDKKVLRKNILQNSIPFTILFGKYDRIILSKWGQRFAQNNTLLVTINTLEAGHQLLKPKYAPDIAALFNG